MVSGGGVGVRVGDVVGRGVELGLVLDGRVVVGLVVVGFGVGVFDGRGGLVPPLVGVSTWLPSQYIAGPSSAMFFRIVLIPAVPGPVHETPLAAF